MATSRGPIKGVDYDRLRVGEADYLAGTAGEGPPVLLLHGFPQTHFCWRAVVPTLAEQRTVVVTDLRGYGDSTAPAGGPHGEGFSKREMARDLVELMARLGFERFAVVGHDRGARVAYRLALDQPRSVERVAILNVLPTIEQFERMDPRSSLAYWPWILLAQPAPFPEMIVAANPEGFLRFIFDSWAAGPGAIDEAALREYVRALEEGTIATVCADYRASFWLDQHHDAADREAGRRIGCPVLVITGEAERQLADAGTIWSTWAQDVRSTTLPGGHFIPEEAPEQLASALGAFMR